MDDLTVLIDISSAGISLKSMKDRHNERESVFIEVVISKIKSQKLSEAAKITLDSQCGAQSAYEHGLIHGLNKDGKDWLCIARRVHVDIFQ